LSLHGFVASIFGYVETSHCLVSTGFKRQLIYQNLRSIALDIPKKLSCFAPNLSGVKVLVIGSAMLLKNLGSILHKQVEASVVESREPNKSSFGEQYTLQLGFNMSQLSHDLQADIIAKAWKDEAFKQELLSNPNATLKALGLKVPSNVEVQVIEETANKVYLVLPSKPSVITDTELSDEQLEAVAGGRMAEATKKLTSKTVTKCCW
jgi:Nitrile hydratase, alpha chain